jgi:hypothetical protein
MQQHEQQLGGRERAPRGRRRWAATIGTALAGILATLTLAALPVVAQVPPRPPIRPFSLISSPEPQQFDATLALRADGGLVALSGPLGCAADAAGEAAEIHATVTQDATAAVAFGVWTGSCTGDPAQQWKTSASALDQQSFQPGPAQACAVGIFRRDGFIVSAGQWCTAVTLALAP